MLIEDPKLALSGSNFRGPAIDNTDDLNDTKTEDTTSAKYVLTRRSITFCICGILSKA